MSQPAKVHLGSLKPGDRFRLDKLYDLGVYTIALADDGSTIVRDPNDYQLTFREIAFINDGLFVFPVPSREGGRA